MENIFGESDDKIITQKALSAIKRTNEQIDIATTVEILRGLHSRKVKENQYDELKTFGVGRDVSIHNWLDYLEQMLTLGFLKTDGYEENLKITDKGNDLLRGNGTIFLLPLEYKISEVEISLYEKKNITRAEDIAFQDLLLYKRLKGLCRTIAAHRRRRINSILKEKAIQEMVRKKPTTFDEAMKIKGISGTRVQTLTILINCIRRHFDLADLDVDIEEPKESKRTRPQKQHSSRKSISVNRIQFDIEESLRDCIHWSGISGEIRSLVRWNLWQDTIISLEDLIPEETEHRDAVVRRFTDILTEGYKLQVRGESVLIPRRIEYDCNGNPVHTLLRESFEDGMNQLEHFLISEQHFPYANSGEYECSLRRWYQELEHEAIFVTSEQKAQFDALNEKYSSLPKYKASTDK